MKLSYNFDDGPDEQQDAYIQPHVRLTNVLKCIGKIQFFVKDYINYVLITRIYKKRFLEDSKTEKVLCLVLQRVRGYPRDWLET